MAKTLIMPFGNSKHSRYSVDVKPVLKSQSGSAVKGASDCCKADVGRKNYCKECNGDVPWKPKYKAFKFNGENHVFEAGSFDKMLDTVGSSDIFVKAVLENEPSEAELLYEKAYFMLPDKKDEESFAELREIIGNRILLAEFNERNSSYQAIIRNRDGILVMKRLADSDLLNEVDMIDEIPVKREVVELKQKILDKNVKQIDITDFHNKRKQLEEQFFDKVIDGDVEIEAVVEDAVKQSNEDELNELKALAGE